MKNREESKNAGFSLIEVVVSMAVLAIISIPLLSYFTESMRYNRMMAEKQKATLLSQEILEQLYHETPLVQKTPSGGYDVPYLTARGYTVEADSIDASGAGTIQLAGQGDVIGEDNDVVITVETKGAAADTSALYGVDNTTDLFVTEKNQLQEALVYFTAVNRAYCAQSRSGEAYSG